jgi:hypothetical protein
MKTIAVTAWDIAGRTVTAEAARAQDELGRQAERSVRLAERTAASLAKPPHRIQLDSRSNCVSLR